MGCGFFAVLIVCSLVLAASTEDRDPGFKPEDLESDETIARLYGRWCEEHGKAHSNEAERLHRLGVFKNKLFQIQEHNAAGHSYWLGLNQFSDTTQEEIEAQFSPVPLEGLIRNKPSSDKVTNLQLNGIPDSIDWRRKGAVTGIKDVGSCKGGAWTYASAGAVEGSLKVNGYPLQDLSGQQLLDCVPETKKCTFGNPLYALKYIEKNGITKNSIYPFTGANVSCKALPPNTFLVTITGSEQLYGSSDDTDLLNAVARQPVAVIIDGSPQQFIDYKGGIYSGPFTPYKPSNMSIGVLVVGYGTYNGTDFWIVKNAWGFGWGEAGYIRIIRKGGPPYGMLNINAFPSYAIGAAPGTNAPPACGSDQKCPSGMTCCCKEPALGSKCTLHMCCPSKYSNCQGGCCTEKKNVGFGEVVFTTQNYTSSSGI